jgi:hypothetical protein
MSEEDTNIPIDCTQYYPKMIDDNYAFKRVACDAPKNAIQDWDCDDSRIKTKMSVISSTTVVVIKHFDVFSRQYVLMAIIKIG